MHARLESAGYRNIEKIERESGSYEIKAIDRNGQRVKLYVHSQTGEVMNRRYRDARHDTTRDKYDKSDSDYAKTIRAILPTAMNGAVVTTCPDREAFSPCRKMILQEF